MLVAAGFPLGAQWWDEPGFAVRLGSDLVSLTAAEYDLWWQARFHPDPAALRGWASGDGWDATGDLDTLRAGGLLAEVTPAGARGFAARHRILPTGVGGGMTADGVCQIWDAATDPVLALDLPTYQCWAFSDGARSIEDVVALVRPAAGISFDGLLHRVVLALPALLASGAAVVDRAPS